MTSPRPDGADRISGVSQSPRSAGAAVSGIAILLLVGLLLRLFLAYVLLPNSGFASDIGTFTAWAAQLAQNGPAGFYSSGTFADYPPGYLYVLWMVGELGHVLAGFTGADPVQVIGSLIKIPPILCDITIGYVLYRIVKTWRGDRSDASRLALIAAAIYVFNPVSWYDSSIWGQTDSVGALVVLLAVFALIRGNSEGASVLAVLAALVKPQFGVVALPIVGIVLLRRHLFDPDSIPRNPVLMPARLRGWFEQERGFWRLVSSAVVSLLVLTVMIIPFSLDIPGLLTVMAQTAGGYPYLSVNAYNAWALLGSGGQAPLAFGGGWSLDTIPLFGPIPGVLVGALLLALGFGLGVLRLVWRDDRRSIVVVTLLLALGFFILPTRVHERYMFPIFAFLPIVAVVDRRWLIATIVLSIAAFINMHGILTTPLYATPNLANMPLGDLFRDPIGILTAIVLNVAGFVFIAWMLRPSAALEPDPYDEPVPAEEPEGPPAEGEVFEPEYVPEPATPWYAPIVALVPRYSIRRDRSFELVNEIGGKLDRKDLLLFIVIFFAALFLRTYRLEVPYDMHFDEVYHARTAMEFLQDWRYGEPHSIYEFTHPHVAKYAMAIGIEILGDHQVVANTDLGVPVDSAVIEQRWAPDSTPDAQYGDRLYIATGSSVEAYDLEQPGPALVATIPGDFVAVAVDQRSHILYMATTDGTVSQLPTSGLDQLRSSGTTDTTGDLAPAPFGQMPDMNGPLERISVIGSNVVGLSTGGTLVSIDPSTGKETGRTQISAVNDMTSAPASDVVMVDPSQVTDRAALAQQLAPILQDDATRIEQVIANATGPVPVAGYVGAAKDDIQNQIDSGEMTGVSITDGTAVALATDSGVTLLDSSTLSQLKQFPLQTPATGLALAARGPDVPTLYVATGASLTTIRLPTDTGATVGDTVWMPNTVTKVYWDEASTNVHALGITQDGTSPTVYVVEPRGNSVFADAKLPFQPQIAVMDANQLYPAYDRNNLLVLSPTGQLATVDTGNNAFAYRFPGVLLGAFTAALIFLLARFLFRRRSIGIIAAILVLADGMFFANSRIAMNDVYVCFFMVAAFCIFVPIWLGQWKNKWVIAGGIFAVGILLGLALASKWVGAYAMGAAALLILLRSSLGRWIALAAMIVMTGVLGYIAITPNPTVVNPQINYLFLGIMVVLTVLLAIGITLRPIRLSRDEFRFAVIVPLLLGIIATAYGGYRLYAGPPAAPGAIFPPSRVLEIGIIGIVTGVGVLALGWFLGRRGRGPLADPTKVDNAAERGEAPPDRGWLRPGSGFLGLPWLLGLFCIMFVPLVVYVISYIPWIALGNQWFTGYPPGHTGQTFLDLQVAMYDYHNYLRATHPASSPWWAWPLDLKPVWFQQESYAAGTTSVIYDTGNIVAFWLAIPAVIWGCWIAWKRRSLPLTFVVIALFAMWLPWARIDRATFQYHVFTVLPFSFMALAYFLAELWHGPSPRTWQLAKVSAALAIIGAPLLWLFRLPLCDIANVQEVNKGTEVCGSLSRDFQLTSFQMIGVLLVILGLVAAGVFAYMSWRGSSGISGGFRPLLLPVSFSIALLGAVILIVGAGLPGDPVFQATVTAEMPAFVALVLLCIPAYFVLQGRDPKRYVVGVLIACVVWFVAFYPNFAALPVPTPLSQIHLGLLPTWNWGFQFGVNLDEPNRNPLDFSAISLLTIATTLLCIAAIYAVRTWKRDHESRAEAVAYAGTGSLPPGSGSPEPPDHGSGPPPAVSLPPGTS